MLSCALGVDNGETGRATPINMPPALRTLFASPYRTMFLRHLAAYEAVRSTFDGSFPRTLLRRAWQPAVGIDDIRLVSPSLPAGADYEPARGVLQVPGVCIKHLAWQRSLMTWLRMSSRTCENPHACMLGRYDHRMYSLRHAVYIL